jgi:hypothetical protein
MAGGRSTRRRPRDRRAVGRLWLRRVRLGERRLRVRQGDEDLIDIFINAG